VVALRKLTCCIVLVCPLCFISSKSRADESEQAVNDRATATASETAEGSKRADKDGRDQELFFLKERRTRLLGDQRWTKAFVRNCFGVAAVMMLLAAVAWLVARTNEQWRYHELVIGLAIILALISCIAEVVAYANRAKLRDLDNDLGQIEFQIDLFSHTLSEEEHKAEKLLRLNDFQLRRYYDLNLTQNRWVFMLGIGCIAAGVIILVATLYAIKHIEPSERTLKIATAVLGGVGAVLTNYVAAIYLKMSASASDSLASFHGRLVGTHQLMLANLIISRIDNSTLRWDTLSKLALKIAPTKETPE
jgi:hypothetical protein